ncbi:hypothetical protein LCGC14_2664450 [marine sediment metagenome]|uniref:Uncharacterized protein n=1 Tax=marine sediment metagenome TaxID=412755 RepID=A0A0F8ZQY7_9ZZZZ
MAQAYVNQSFRAVAAAMSEFLGQDVPFRSTEGLLSYIKNVWENMSQAGTKGVGNVALLHSTLTNASAGGEIYFPGKAPWTLEQAKAILRPRDLRKHLPPGIDYDLVRASVKSGRELPTFIPKSGPIHTSFNSAIPTRAPNIPADGPIPMPKEATSPTGRRRLDPDRAKRASARIREMKEKRSRTGWFGIGKKTAETTKKGLGGIGEWLTGGKPAAEAQAQFSRRKNWFRQTGAAPTDAGAAASLGVRPGAKAARPGKLSFAPKALNTPLGWMALMAVPWLLGRVTDKIHGTPDDQRRLTEADPTRQYFAARAGRIREQRLIEQLAQNPELQKVYFSQMAQQQAQAVPPTVPGLMEFGNPG